MRNKEWKWMVAVEGFTLLPLKICRSCWFFFAILCMSTIRIICTNGTFYPSMLPFKPSMHCDTYLQKWQMKIAFLAFYHHKEYPAILPHRESINKSNWCESKIKWEGKKFHFADAHTRKYLLLGKRLIR